jgi:hypothetical protein
VRRAGSQEQPSEQPTQLRELAKRLLARPFAAPGESPRTVQLLPGQLPGDLPLDVPLLPGSRIVGSVVHSSDQSERQTGGSDAQALPEVAPGTESVIVLDTPQAAADVRAFYERELAARGWKAAPHDPFKPSGFQPAQIPFPQVFCQSSVGAWLSVSVLPMTSGLSDVRLSIYANAAGGPCTSFPGQASLLAGSPPGAELIPPLYGPEGVHLGPTGGGGGPGRWTSDATISTEQGVAELEAYFARQLQAAGWTRLTGRADGPLAWSTWKVPSEGEWQGLLFVLELPGTDRRELHVQAISASAEFSPYSQRGFGLSGSGERGTSPAVRLAPPPSR